MNLKIQPKFKSYSYRLCDEAECDKIAWKVIGERSFCDRHHRIYLEEEKAKESNSGNASTATTRQ